jgi:hypothetical protein
VEFAVFHNEQPIFIMCRVSAWAKAGNFRRLTVEMSDRRPEQRFVLEVPSGLRIAQTGTRHQGRFQQLEKIADVPEN